MSNEIGIGKFIVSPQARDAIHVAVFPAFSKFVAIPGEKAYLVSRFPDSQGRLEVIGDHALGFYSGEAIDKPVGIIDPFLEYPAPKGVGFWVALFPGTATGLRHRPPPRIHPPGA